MGLDLKHLARHPSLKIALGIALALASAGAAALGLGQIEVKSRIGQPLLAEIPIISSDPGELEELRAGLAPPETFARIGLTPPRGVVADLQFAPALNAAGQPILRVTSAQPVNEPLLTFLVQVDWGQGRLVREYSALVDTPRTVSAPVQPPIQAPVIAQPDLVERPLPPPAAVAISTPPPPPVPVRAAAPVPVPQATRAAEPVRRDNAIATATRRPVPVPVATRGQQPAPSTASPGQYGPVKAGESLSQIAGRLDMPGGVSLEHSMIALLRANPDAFIGGNINQLKRGAVLRVPASAETADVDARQAMALVQAQARQWRQARQAVPPPAADANVASPSRRTVATPAPVAARASGARLEIVPPGASRATRAGTQSGINAGGEGQMLRQELQQTKESLAARDAELRELKGRVADLEKLRADQQQLLTLKDSELAAAQQRLAVSNKAVAAPPVAAQTQTAATADKAVAPQEQASIMPWLLGGFGVLLVALLAGWLLRRRRPAATSKKFVAPAPMSAASLADAFASFPPKAAEQGTSGSDPALSAATPMTNVDEAAERDANPVVADASPAAPLRSEPIEPSPAAIDEAALWDRRDRQKLPTGRPDASAAPAWHAGGAGKSRVVETPAAAAVAEASVGERLELAQAYLDLGDRESARQLLGEVAGNGDPASRQQASRMLRELD